METIKFIYYREDDTFIGWLEEFPDYRTQGQTIEELKENLRDLCTDLVAAILVFTSIQNSFLLQYPWKSKFKSRNSLRG